MSVAKFSEVVENLTQPHATYISSEKKLSSSQEKHNKMEA